MIQIPRTVRINRAHWQADRLVGWWPALDVRGGVDALGEYANHIPTTITGTLAPVLKDPIGQWLNFGTSGNAYYAEVADNNLFDFGTGAFTVAVWCGGAAPTNAVTMLVSKMSISGSATGFRLQRGNGISAGRFTFRFVIWTGGSASEATTGADATLFSDTLRHVVGVREADGTLRIYIDGVLINSNSTPVLDVSNNGSMQIGADHVNGSYGLYWDGFIGETRIYNRALSADEVAQLYGPGRWDLYAPSRRIWMLANTRTYSDWSNTASDTTFASTSLPIFLGHGLFGGLQSISGGL